MYKPSELLPKRWRIKSFDFVKDDEGFESEIDTDALFSCLFSIRSTDNSTRLEGIESLSVLLDQYREIPDEYINFDLIDVLLEEASKPHSIYPWICISFLTNGSDVTINMFLEHSLLKTIVLYLNNTIQIHYMKHVLRTLHNIASNASIFRLLLSPLNGMIYEVSPVEGVMNVFQNHLSCVKELPDLMDGGFQNDEDLEDIRCLILEFFLALITQCSKKECQPSFLPEIVSIVFQSLVFRSKRVIELVLSGCEKLFEEYPEWMISEYKQNASEAAFITFLKSENGFIRTSIAHCLEFVIMIDQKEGKSLFEHGLFEALECLPFENENEIYAVCSIIIHYCESYPYLSQLISHKSVLIRLLSFYDDSSFNIKADLLQVFSAIISSDKSTIELIIEEFDGVLPKMLSLLENVSPERQNIYLDVLRTIADTYSYNMKLDQIKNIIESENAEYIIDSLCCSQSIEVSVNASLLKSIFFSEHC